MNCKAVGLAAMIAASLALLYILTRDEPKTMAASVPVEAVAAPPVADRDPRQLDSMPNVQLPPPQVETKTPRSKPRFDPEKTPRASNMPGSYPYTPSVEWNTYVLLSALGSSPGALRATQVGAKLTDEELSQLVELSKSVKQDDLAIQRQLLAEICNRRDSFQRIEEWGAAFNERARKLEEAQETLGRRARDKLDPELFSKIDARVRSQPPREIARTDFSAVLVERNANLQEVIERSCSLKF